MIKKTVAATLMVMISGAALADDETTPTNQGNGVVNFVGAIIDSPCSIAPEDIEQTIQLGMISNELLENQGESPLRAFGIKLENCSVATAKTATITFNGIADDTEKKHLAIQGTAKGAAIAMVNQLDGSEIVLGTPTKAMDLVEGDNHLKFGAKVVSNINSGDKATPGNFTATADFVMNYQ